MSSSEGDSFVEAVRILWPSATAQPSWSLDLSVDGCVGDTGGASLAVIGLVERKSLTFCISGRNPVEKPLLSAWEEESQVQARI